MNLPSIWVVSIQDCLEEIGNEWNESIMQQYIHAATTDLDIQNLDYAVSRVFDSLMPNPLLQSPTLITGVVFTSGIDSIINHKLGRAVKGYVLVGSTASSTLYTSPTTNSNPKIQIILRTNANTTANVLFF